MLPENAAALVGAGLVSVFLFPLLGMSLRPARQPAAEEPAAPVAAPAMPVEPATSQGAAAA